MKRVISILIGLSVLSIGSFANGLLLNFLDINVQSLVDRFANVNFVAPGNNFGGALFWLPTKSLQTGQVITLTGEDDIFCTKLVRGLYYNNQRGQRIWPLDDYSLNSLRGVSSGYDNLNIEGGLYTTCNTTGYDIYGQIKYNLSGMESYVFAGLGLEYDQNSYTGKFVSNFQYFDNKVPLGYIFDSVGGIGFVGGWLTGHDYLIDILNNDIDVNTAFSYSGDEIVSASGYDDDFWFRTGRVVNLDAQDMLWNLAIQGIVSLSKSMSDMELQSVLGNLKDKTILFKAPNITSSVLMNQVAKESQSLCRGREISQGPNLLSSNSDDVLCYIYDGYHTDNYLNIDMMDDKGDYENKTIIVKNADVYLENSMDDSDAYLDLFIDKGNLYLINNPISNYIQDFDGEGYVDGSVATSGVYLKGNIIVNGLMIGYDGSNMTGYKHKLFLHGKVSSLNSPLVPSEGRIKQVRNLFDTTEYDARISLQNTFSWFCNPASGLGNDGSSCSHPDDENALLPFIVIDRKFDSRLF